MRAPVLLTVLAGGGELARLATQIVVDRPETTAVVAPAAIIDRVAPLRAVAVQADLGSRTPGCDCCQVRVDLIDGVGRAVRRRTPPERVLVVLDPADDAVTAVHTVLSDPDLRRLVHLDGVVVTVDAVQLATRLAVGASVETAGGLDRLAIADRILVARSREVTGAALGRIGQLARSLNRTGPVLAPAIAPCFVDQLVGLNAWHGAPHVGPPVATPVANLPADAPTTVVCRSERELDPDRVDEWLDAIIGQHASRLLRLQGAVTVAGQQDRTCFHGVRSYAMSHSEADHAPGDRSGTSTVMLVGRQLPAETLQAEFAATCR